MQHVQKQAHMHRDKRYISYHSKERTKLTVISRSEISHTCRDEIAIVVTAPAVTEITQTNKSYDVPCLTVSCLENLKCDSWYI